MKQFEIGMVIKAIDKASGPVKGIVASLDRMTKHTEVATTRATRRASRVARGGGESIGAALKGGIGAALGGVAGVVGGVITVGATVEGIKRATMAASDLNETVSKSQQVFGKSTQVVANFAKSAADNFGLSRKAALDYSSSFGLILQGSGLGDKTTADMSVGLSKLSADLASFFNTDIETAADKLRSGLVGEAEPLREFGVLLSENAVKAKALAMGFKATKGQLSEGAKVQARYALILEMTKKAHGDYGRTASGLANTQRKLQAQFDNIVAILGQAFLPIITKAASGLSGLLARFEEMSPAIQKQFGGSLDWIASTAKGLVPTLREVGQQMIRNFTGALGTFDVGAIKESFTGWIPIVTGIFKNYYPKIAQILGQITKWIVDIWVKSQPGLRSLAKAFEPALKVIFKLWDKVLAPMVGWLASVAVPFLVNVMGPALAVMTDLTSQLLDKLIDGISGAGQWIEQTTKAITGAWGKAFEWVEKGWKGMLDNLLNWFTRHIDMVIRPFRQLGGLFGIPTSDTSAGPRLAPAEAGKASWVTAPRQEQVNAATPIVDFSAKPTNVTVNIQQHIDHRASVKVRSVIGPQNGAMRLAGF